MIGQRRLLQSLGHAVRTARSSPVVLRLRSTPRRLFGITRTSRTQQRLKDDAADNAREKRPPLLWLLPVLGGLTFAINVLTDRTLHTLEASDEARSIHALFGSPTGQYPDRLKEAKKFDMGWLIYACVRVWRMMPTPNKGPEYGHSLDETSIPAGRRVEVQLPDGRKTEAYVSGVSSPTVVINCGSLSHGAELQRELSKETRCVVYCHAGMMRPDPFDPPEDPKLPSRKEMLADVVPAPTSTYEADELAAVLEAVGVNDDVILLATHYNWLATLKFAKRNAESVLGVCLVDPYLPQSDFHPPVKIKNAALGAPADPLLVHRFATPANPFLHALTPQFLADERLFRHALVFPRFMRGISDVSLLLGRVRHVPNFMLQPETAANPRVEYLHRQILCLKLEDYWIRNRLVRKGVEGLESGQQLGKWQSAPPHLLTYKPQAWFQDLGLDDLPPLETFCRRGIAWFEQFLGHPHTVAVYQESSNPATDSLPDWTRSQEHAAGLLQMVRRNFRAEKLGCPVFVLMTSWRRGVVWKPERGGKPIPPSEVDVALAQLREELRRHVERTAQEWKMVLGSPVGLVRTCQGVADPERFPATAVAMSTWVLEPEVKDIAAFVTNVVQVARRQQNKENKTREVEEE